MESLENIIKVVNTLKNDLYSTVELEIGHYEPTFSNVHSCSDASSTVHCGYPSAGGCPNGEVWIKDGTNRVPDNNKINAAKSALGNVYASSKWYAARHHAAKALGIENLETNLSQWISELKNFLNSSKTPEPILRIRYVIDASALQQGCRDSGYNQKECCDNPCLKLMQVLRDTYEKDPDTKVRARAGEELGYSKSQIEIDELSK